MIGSIQGDQSISFQAMKKKLAQLQEIVQDDPAVDTRRRRHRRPAGQFRLRLHLAEALRRAPDHRRRRRQPLCAASWRRSPGARLFLVAVSDLRTGGRQSNATYQYTLLSDDTAELYKWAPRLTAGADEIRRPEGRQFRPAAGRAWRPTSTSTAPTAKRLGLTLSAIDNTLYDAFGQRQVSTIYNALNQYHVVMEVGAALLAGPRDRCATLCLDLGRQSLGHAVDQYRRGGFYSAPTRGDQHDGGDARRRFGAQPRHQLARRQRPFQRLGRRGGVDVAGDDGPALGRGRLPPRPHAARRQPSGPVRRRDDLVQSRARARRSATRKTAIDAAVRDIGMPSTVRGAFAGTARRPRSRRSRGQLLLIGAALLAVYHRARASSTRATSTRSPSSRRLPSASVGALIALKLFNTEFTIIAFIGIILLIGIVKKNAIMMIDFALQAEREGLDTRGGDSRRPACCASARS